MIEFQFYYNDFCNKCGKQIPYRWYTWCTGGLKFCSYQCFKTHQAKIFFYSGHGMQIKHRIKRAIDRLLYKINPIRFLREWDGTSYWGY